MKKEIKYCSQCKWSKYMRYKNKNYLQCSRAEDLGLVALMPARCIEAMECPLYEPVKRELKGISNWLQDVRECRISLTEYAVETYKRLP